MSWLQNMSKPEQLSPAVKPPVTPAKPVEKEPGVTPAPKPEIVQFIDISHFQDKMKWDAVKPAGFQAVVAKATDGVNPTKLFAEHAVNSAHRGLTFGAYCFNRFHADPIKQADIFANRAEHYTRWIVADIEFDKSKTTAARFGDKYVAKMDNYAADHSMKFLERLEAMGFHPWIYSNTFYFYGFVAPERFARFPYWASNYTQKTRAVKDLDVSKVPLPKPYKKAIAWQWTDRHAAAKAITGTPNLDGNVYWGSLEDLRTLARVK